MFRRLLAVLLGLTLLLAACGGSDETDTTDTTPADTTPDDSMAEDTTPADTTPDDAMDDDADADHSGADDDDAMAEDDDAVAEDDAMAEGDTPDYAAIAGDSGATAVLLSEWTVDSPTEFGAGEVSLQVFNTGEFPHQLVVAKGDSYESLPLLDNGAVDEAALGDAVIGGIDTLASGTDGKLTVDLEAGNYVFFCNIIAGPVSHAANGQTLSVSVS